MTKLEPGCMEIEMTKLEVTVVYPQTFQFEIDESWESKTKEEKRQAIVDHADYLMESSPSRPIITACNDKSLED